MGSAIRPTVAEPAPTRWEGPAPSGDTPWRVGDVVLDTYEVLQVFAAGGMGLVYRVRHRGWGLELAVKRPRPEYFQADEQRADFEREAETWAGLGLHPHVVTCHYVRRIDGVPCVFAEYAAHGSLADRLRDGPLSMADALDAGIQAAWGLAHAHARGLVHQDVKPANLLRAGPAVKVSDFGLAGARAAVQPGPATGPGRTATVAGAGTFTPEYAAPEQFAGEPLTRRTDVWAWAVTLLELLTGRRPAVGPAAPDLLATVDRAGWPAGLFDLLRECLSADPAVRPRDMDAIVARLRDVYRTATGTDYPRRPPRAARLDLDAKNNRGVSLADLGKPAEAEALWAEVLRAERDHPEAGYNLALARWRAGRATFDEIISDLREVAAAFPDDPRPAVLAARIHLEAGDPVEAASALGSTAGPDAVAVREEIRAHAAHMPVQRWSVAYPDNPAQVVWAGHHHIVTAGHDRLLRVWEADTGHLVRTLSGHTCPPQGLVASADGRRVLAGTFAEDVGGTAELFLWDVRTGEVVWKAGQQAKHGTYQPLLLDEELAVVFAEGQLQAWADGDLAADVQTGHNQAAACAAGVIVTLGGEREETRLRVWVLPGTSPVNEFPVSSQAVDLAVTADGRHATARVRGALRHWDLTTGEEAVGPPPGAVGLAVSHGGPVEYSQHQLTVRQATTDRPVALFAPHGNNLAAFALGPDGRLSTVGDQALAVWQLDPAATPYTAPPAVCVARRSEAVVAAEEACDAELEAARAAMARRDYPAAARHVRAARRQPGAARRADALALWAELSRHLARGAFARGWWADSVSAPGTNDLAATADGRRLIVARHLGFQVWDVDGTRFEREAATARHVALSPDGRIAYLATGVVGRPLRLTAWQMESDTDLWEADLPGLAVGFAEIRVTADGRTVFTVQGDQSVRRWHAATGELLATYTGRLGGVRALAPAADGSWFASVDMSGAARLLDAATGQCRRTLVDADAWAVAVAGRVVLVGRAPDHDGIGPPTHPLPASEVLTLWDAGTGERIRSLEWRAGGASCVALSADGGLAVAGYGNTAAVWDADTGVLLRAFPGHGDAVEAVAAANDHRRVFTAAGDTVRVWDLDWELTDAPAKPRPIPPPVTWDNPLTPSGLTVQAGPPPVRLPTVPESLSLPMSKLVLAPDGLYRGRLDGPQTLLYPLADIQAVAVYRALSRVGVVCVPLFLGLGAAGYYGLSGGWAVAAGVTGLLLGLFGLFGSYPTHLVVTTGAGKADYEINDEFLDAQVFTASVRVAASRNPDPPE